MKILMILDKEFPIDERVEKEALALRDEGHKVNILSFRYSSDKKKYEEYKGIKIHRVFISRFFVKKLKPFILTGIDIYSLYWSKLIAKFISKNKIDVLHIHDLYLGPAAIKFKEKTSSKVKLVLDLHENYPYAIKNYTYSNQFPLKYLIPFKKWIVKEKEFCNKVDYIITVAEEMKSRIANFCDKNKIYVVSNYIDKKMIYGEYEENKKIVEKLKTKFIVSYIGGFDIHKGIEVLISAMQYVNNNIYLVIVGKGRNYDKLKKLTSDLGVQDNVMFEGWKHHDLLPNYYTNTDVFCIPHIKAVQSDNSSPGKLFRYMAAGKPIIASNCDSIVKVIKNAQCGLIFQSGDEKELSEKLNYLYGNKNVCKEFGNNSLISFDEKYNWEKAKINLLKIYKTIDKV